MKHNSINACRSFYGSPLHLPGFLYCAERRFLMGEGGEGNDFGFVFWMVDAG